MQPHQRRRRPALSTANHMAHDSSGVAPEDAGPQPVSPADDPREVRLQEALRHIRQALTSLRFGQLVITVQDGLVVQVDRTEKTRLR